MTSSVIHHIHDFQRAWQKISQIFWDTIRRFQVFQAFQAFYHVPSHFSEPQIKRRQPVCPTLHRPWIPQRTSRTLSGATRCGAKCCAHSWDQTQIPRPTNCGWTIASCHGGSSHKSWDRFWMLLTHCHLLQPFPPIFFHLTQHSSK